MQMRMLPMCKPYRMAKFIKFGMKFGRRRGSAPRWSSAHLVPTHTHRSTINMNEKVPTKLLSKKAARPSSAKEEVLHTSELPERAQRLLAQLCVHGI